MLKELLEKQKKFPWEIKGQLCHCSMPLVMGIVNVTPDSFFDGGKHNTLEKAYEHSLKLLEDGAEILDIGGESTRPQSKKISLQEELDRVCPLVEKLTLLTKEKNFFISIDTTKSEVALECSHLGAHIINDISACTFDKKMAKVIYENNVSVILNHTKGNPETMQTNYTPYEDVQKEVLEQLQEQAKSLIQIGIKKERICIDPGIGFGKSLKDNLDLIKYTDEFANAGFATLIGTSRKSYIGKISGLQKSDRLIPSITGGIVAAIGGISCIRTHDVKETKESLLYLEAFKNGAI